jgi:hypothetical protein
MWETTKEAGAKPGQEQSRDLEIITITCALKDVWRSITGSRAYYFSTV